MDEDEGWQSDGPLRPSHELQELVSRVTLLETQIRSSAREGRAARRTGNVPPGPGETLSRHQPSVSAALCAVQIESKQLHSNKQENNRISDANFIKYKTKLSSSSTEDKSVII